MHEKIKVSPKEMAYAFFYAAANSTKHVLDNSEALKDLDITNINESHVFIELMIIHMFANRQVINSQIADINISKDIINFMDDYFYEFIKRQFTLTDEYMKDFSKHMYAELYQYYNIINCNDSDNYMPSLSRVMLSNIKKEETLNSISISNMAIEFTSIVKFRAELLDDYDILGSTSANENITQNKSNLFKKIFAKFLGL